MKIISSSPQATRITHFVELGPEDSGRTDAELITAADNGGKYGQRVTHSGGAVNRLRGHMAEIVVYID